MKADATPTKRLDVEATLRARLISGLMQPADKLSTRKLAQELGVSAMPVRDALARLAAEGALEIQKKKKAIIPAMTRGRFEEIQLARELLEPEAAVRSLGQLTRTTINRMKRFDADIEAAMREKNVDRYMQANAGFHFALYRACAQPVILRLIETLWLQTGPYQGYVLAQWGVHHLKDQHERALEAIEKREAKSLKNAIRQDIRDGMRLISEQLKNEGVWK
jgi:DNA-binding GntR family transcriptional regulator